MKLLLIDHEVYRIQSLMRGLRIAGLQAFEAATAEEALAHIRREDACIDCIVTDSSTRILSKPEVVDALRERFPALQVVLMTDRSSWDLGMEGLPWTTHLLHKPFTDADLIRLIDALRRESGAP